MMENAVGILVGPFFDLCRGMATWKGNSSTPRSTTGHNVLKTPSGELLFFPFCSNK